MRARLLLFVLPLVFAASCATSGKPAVLGAAISTPGVDPAGNGADGQAAFLASSSGEVLFVRWTNNDGALAVTIDESQINRDVVGQEADATGTLAGRAVDLQLNNGQHWTGTLSGHTLVLHVPESDGSLQPVTLTAASINDYNSAIAQLHQQVQSSAAARSAADQQAALAAAVAQADNDVAADLRMLTTDADTLRRDAEFANDITSMTNDLTGAQKDLTTEHSDATQPGNCGTVQGDAGTVDGDFGSMQGDQGSLDGDISSLQADVSSATHDLATLSDDVSTLNTALAATSGASADSTAAQIAAARKATADAIGAANTATTNVKTQAASLIAQGKSVQKQADTFAASCTS